MQTEAAGHPDGAEPVVQELVYDEIAYQLVPVDPWLRLSEQLLRGAVGDAWTVVVVGAHIYLPWQCGDRSGDESDYLAHGWLRAPYLLRRKGADIAVLDVGV